MNITFAPRGILQIDDAKIIFRNFAGAPSKFNREGDRNFAVVINDMVRSIDDVQKLKDNGWKDDEIFVNEDAAVVPAMVIADRLATEGWNVKIRDPKEEFDNPFIFLPVKIKFNDRGPRVYLVSGNNTNNISEDMVSMLDNIDIITTSMDIRPYDWDVNGKTGRTAYLQVIEVVQNVDRFAERYNSIMNEPMDPDDPF